MDPSLFRIDWAVLTETLVAIIVFAFFVERILSLLFESKVYIEYFYKWKLKEVLSLGLSWFLVATYQLDAFAIIFHGDANTNSGYFFTAAIVAGGSKASIALFHDLMKVKSSAEKTRTDTPTASPGS